MTHSAGKQQGDVDAHGTKSLRALIERDLHGPAVP